jgi:energy-converting hydrogenase Eha subunit B
MSGLLQVVGIAGAIHSQVLKYLFGVYFTHPGFFVGSIVAAIALQFGSEKLEESTLLGEIDNICTNL